MWGFFFAFVIRRCVHSFIVMSIIKRQAVITEKYGAHGCNVGEDGGFAPNISRQVY
jgi:hypothetical protein